MNSSYHQQYDDYITYITTCNMSNVVNNTTTMFTTITSSHIITCNILNVANTTTIMFKAIIILDLPFQPYNNSTITIILNLTDDITVFILK